MLEQPAVDDRSNQIGESLPLEEKTSIHQIVAYSQARLRNLEIGGLPEQINDRASAFAVIRLNWNWFRNSAHVATRTENARAMTYVDEKHSRAGLRNGVFLQPPGSGVSYSLGAGCGRNAVSSSMGSGKTMVLLFSPAILSSAPR